MEDSKKKIVIELDILFSKIVRKEGKCRMCATTFCIDNAHIFSRKNMSVRWDLDNCVSLCRTHHQLSHFQPEEFREYMSKIYGEEKWNNLVIKANQIKKFTVDDLKELYIELKKQL